MTDEPLTVVKYGQTFSNSAFSAEQLEVGRAVQEVTGRAVAGIDRWMNATDEERAQRAAEGRQRETEAEVKRAEERAAAEQAPLTLETLTSRLDAESGWDRAYLEHLVQPYCRCGVDIDGWSYCQHARDLRLAA